MSALITDNARVYTHKPKPGAKQQYIAFDANLCLLEDHVGD